MIKSLLNLHFVSYFWQPFEFEIQKKLRSQFCRRSESGWQSSVSKERRGPVQYRGDQVRRTSSRENWRVPWSRTAEWKWVVKLEIRPRPLSFEHSDHSPKILNRRQFITYLLSYLLTIDFEYQNKT